MAVEARQALLCSLRTSLCSATRPDAAMITESKSSLGSVSPKQGLCLRNRKAGSLIQIRSGWGGGPGRAGCRPRAWGSSALWLKDGSQGPPAERGV